MSTKSRDGVSDKERVGALADEEHLHVANVKKKTLRFLYKWLSQGGWPNIKEGLLQLAAKQLLVSLLI